MSEKPLSASAKALMERVEDLMARGGIGVEVDWDCDECHDVRWVRIEIPHPEEGAADHYMRECSRCLPERYRIMVTEDHGTRCRRKGGCSVCRKYVQPWLNGKGVDKHYEL